MLQKEEQLRLLRQELRSFVDREIIPHTEAIEQSRIFPSAVFSRLGELGYLDLTYYNHRPDARYNCVESVMVNGKMVMENRQFGFDQREVYAKAAEVAKRLWARTDALPADGTSGIKR